MTKTVTSFRIAPLTRQEALQILAWRYEPPFDFYNPPQPKQTSKFVKTLLDSKNGFFGVRDSSNKFFGFCSFGTDGQVLGGCYPQGPLDIGLGMTPVATGNGSGFSFFSALMDFAQHQFGMSRFRLTVASFNTRAINVYQRYGFEPIDQFIDLTDGLEHIIMAYSIDKQDSTVANASRACMTDKNFARNKRVGETVLSDGEA